jgi:hypothetical protein
MASEVQAPRTVGPNLAELTIREQAAAAWATKAAEERRKAERAALRLALELFGPVPVEFDQFVPEPYARRFGYAPAQLVTFELEGLEFNYTSARKNETEHLCLIDRCPHCETGIRVLKRINTLADIGEFYATHESGVPWWKCQRCRKDDDDDQ